ncbi:unnamed protein product [Arctia plantaginis]|uniref:Proteasome subunit beta n=1 Tax=Arctia plantaginis TaxID=874455 RepID=A0A8S0ZYK3_ARCPL|nr:unnamed protein product [Arctia plantaginis]CAB3240118.1 unnamed protein product [Arctia plantaginis]
MTESSLHIQCLIGIQCQDFTMLAADQTSTLSIIVMKNDVNKLHDLTSKQVLGIIGDSGDTMQLTQFICKNLMLYQMKNGYQLSTEAVVHFIRKNVMESLKSGTPCIVNMLVGGYDQLEGGQLYTLDFLASALRVPYGVHGFGGIICLGLLDRYHKSTMTETEGYDLIKTCVHQIHERLFINLPNFQVKLVNKDGIQTLPAITPATFAAQINF